MTCDIQNATCFVKMFVGRLSATFQFGFRFTPERYPSGDVSCDFLVKIYNMSWIGIRGNALGSRAICIGTRQTD
jgi:hypothetical protein